MNTKRVLISFGITVAILCSSGCKKEGEQPPPFSTPEEAANKGKSDLLSLLRSRKDVALGFEEQTIEKAEPATPIRQFQITFEDLMAAGSFAGLKHNELATVVPLVAGDTVATVVGVVKGEAGWRVASLADKSLSSELDIVRKAAGSQADIAIYNLPHSGVKVYGVTPAGAGEAAAVFYTNYTGFNVREAVPTDPLLPVIKQDAAEFQRTYAEELKRRKLAR